MIIYKNILPKDFKTSVFKRVFDELFFIDVYVYIYIRQTYKEWNFLLYYNSFTWKFFTLAITSGFLNDNESPQLSETFADVRSTVVWTISILTCISSSSIFFSRIF